MTEMRNYRRIPFHTTAAILLDEHQADCELVDIALRGALVEAKENIPLLIGDHARVQIELPNAELNLTFGVELIHRQEELYGFLFIDADDESLAHLRRLLELNLGDGEQVDREFIHWLQHPHH